MSSDEGAKILTIDEIAEMGLPSAGEGEVYIPVFVLNDKLTNSGEHEGGPFKVSTRGLDPIGRTVVGRPYIIGPDPRRHVRAASGEPEDILKLQERFAVGEFVRYFRKGANVHGIVKVFKEFVDLARQGKIPKFSSPMIGNFKQDPLTGEITDGRILHVQGVSNPGYSPEVSKVGPACVGMLDKCMEKIRTLAAAGQLVEFQASIDNSLSSESKNESSEPLMDSKQKQELAGELFGEIIKDPEKVNKLLAAAGPEAATALLEKVTSSDVTVVRKEPGDAGNKDALKGVAPKIDTKGKDPEGQAAQDSDSKGEVDIESHPKFKAMQKEVDELKADRADRARLDVIRELVDLEAKLHIISFEDRAERIKKYQALSGEEGSVGAFKLLMKTYNAEKKKLVAAAGPTFPVLHLNEDSDEVSTGDLVDTFESVGRSY